MAKHRQEYLKYLLEQERWTGEEKEWMFHYLESNELSELKTVAAEEYNMDVASYANVRDIRMSEEVLERIHQRIEPTKSFAEQIIRFRWIKYVVAACVALFVGLGYLFFDEMTGGLTGKREHTAANERKTIKLPDGSLVSLEPGSKLEYAKKFNGETREVRLKGEAFFEITKDPAHPFTIHTKQINTTVLGTSFNVEAYESKEARVVVVTGRVKVQAENGNKQILSPNESVVYSSKTGELQKGNAQDEVLFYEMRRAGKLNYRGTALYKVVEDLQRLYKTTIAIEGNVKACLFYGDLFINDDLDKALNLIAISINATIKNDTNKGYLIIGGNCR